jgi:hypothetical protein
MAIQHRRSEDELAVIAGAIIVGMGLAAGVSAAVTFLLNRRTTPRPAVDPVLEMFRTAPIDDELLTEEQAARIDVARTAAARGEVVPLAIDSISAMA